MMAKQFAIYDSIDSSFFIVPNEGSNAEHGAGTGAAAFLAQKKIHAVIAPEVGPKAAQTLEAAGITIENVKPGIPLGDALADILGY
jgi:predicted Fe-Mo cluster-binding NifX family protein